MKEPVMLDIWDELTLEEKQACVLGLQRTDYRNQKIEWASIGMLPFCTIYRVEKAIAGTEATDNLGLKDEYEARKLWKNLGMKLSVAQ